jgi:hypothetical protein
MASTDLLGFGPGSGRAWSQKSPAKHRAAATYFDLEFVSNSR